jgi:2-(1,2-epoxy-1,2-dihydrophenyl)acetyl-CoA isomerase
MMNTNEDSVVLRMEGGVAHIVLNRPAVLNAVDIEMAEALLNVCRAVAADPAVRVVVLKGAGKAFMAGGNLARFHEAPAQAPETADHLIRLLNAAVEVLDGLRVPVVASLHGAVAGAGVSLALACDLAIAADNTRFNLAYARIGATPDVSASWHLPRVVGLRKAMEIALLAENVDAAEAQRLGLVNRVVTADSLDAETAALAARLAAGPTRAYGATKRLLRESSGRSLREQLELERAAFCSVAASADFAEGVDAFYGKRAAAFTGQ